MSGFLVNVFLKANYLDHSYYNLESHKYEIRKVKLKVEKSNKTNFTFGKMCSLKRCTWKRNYYEQQNTIAAIIRFSQTDNIEFLVLCLSLKI